MKRKAKRRMTEAERAEAGAFHQSVQGRSCAVCGRGGHMDAHHVVQAQHCKGWDLPVWDTRNALPLCRDCHMNVTVHSLYVPRERLTRENVAFACGHGVGWYLSRYYPERTT